MITTRAPDGANKHIIGLRAPLLHLTSASFLFALKMNNDDNDENFDDNDYDGNLEEQGGDLHYLHFHLTSYIHFRLSR